MNASKNKAILWLVNILKSITITCPSSFIIYDSSSLVNLVPRRTSSLAVSHCYPEIRERLKEIALEK